MSSIVLSIFLLSIGASFIQRTTGFGFGIFIMTMLPFLMPSYGEATTLSGLLAITGYHDFCSYRMAIAKLRHLAAALADSADVYHRLDYCHFRPDTHRRPYSAANPWRGTHPD